MHAQTSQPHEAALGSILATAWQTVTNKKLLTIVERVVARDYPDLIALQASRGCPLTALPEASGPLLWNLNKLLDDPRQRRVIAEAAGRIGVAASPPPIGAADALRNRGLASLPPLMDAAECAVLLDSLRTTAKRTQVKTLTYYDIDDLVRAPHVLRVATAPAVLDAVRAFLGPNAAIVDLNAWESPPNPGEPDGAQVFHRDKDDFRACKLFVYLTDVGPENGPHIFVRGSHDWEAAAARFPEQPPESLLLLFIHHSRQIADQVEGLFGPDVLEITGPAGTCFLEATYGFHRGKVPTGGTRAIFQVLYACTPYPQRLERLGAITAAAPANLDASARQALRFVWPG